jgi:glucose-6-phosphate 1-dehydrogenase
LQNDTAAWLKHIRIQYAIFENKQMKKSRNQILVIFGASGDLTKRKLLPALFDLFMQNLLPEKFIVLGASRTKMTDEAFRKKSDQFLPRRRETEEFKKLLFYETIIPTEAEYFNLLASCISKLSKKFGIDPNCIFYLSTPPSVYGIIAGNLAKAGLSSSEKYFRRLIVEKPFGADLNSARELNADLLNFFDEGQLYRIDHYLGKETVRNMLVTRFANGIFDPLWNRNFIDHIDVPFSVFRGQYTDSVIKGKQA